MEAECTPFTKMNSMWITDPDTNAKPLMTPKITKQNKNIHTDKKPPQDFFSNAGSNNSSIFFVIVLLTHMVPATFHGYQISTQSTYTCFFNYKDLFF